MIIGIDGNEANVENRVGIGEYAFEILKEFNKSASLKVKFEIYLKHKPLESMPKESGYWQYKIFGPSKLWTQVALPFNLFFAKSKPDVFFSPSHYAPRFTTIRTAISIMDLSFLYFPELFKKKDLYQLKNWTEYSAKNAAKIFTISRSSKDDIIKEYNKKSTDIIITYPGIKKKPNIMTQESSFLDIQKKYSVSKNYILFVGTIQPRKNIERLIEAFFKLKIKDLQLVIVGKKGWLYEPILAKPRELGIENQIKFLDFVADNDLAVLYKNTICYCLPSLYEGFGLPVLEAMQHGCPVITSNVSSLPEAGGDACLYVDPLDVDDIAKKLELIIKDQKLRKDLIKKGYEQIKKFSWEKTAKETLKVLTEL